MASGVRELSVNVRLCDALLTPTIVFANVMLAVESVAVICGGAGGLPLPPPQPEKSTAKTAHDEMTKDLRIALRIRLGVKLTMEVGYFQGLS